MSRDRSPTLTVAVTGGNGYVGSVLRRAITTNGWRAISLQRSAGEADSRRFALGEPLSPDLFGGIDVLIHAAYDFLAYGWDAIQKANVEGSMALFRAAQAADVKRLILISSISAFEGCVSEYGRAKLELENQSAALGVVIVRPGLVWGGSSGGMMGSLGKLAGLPVVMPMVGSGNQPQYLDHEEDLGRLIVQLAGSDARPDRPIIAANETPLTLKQIMTRLASRKKIPVPIPWRLLWLGLKTLESIGLRPRTRSDSLISLMNSNPSPDFTATKALGISFRSFSAPE